eukprot:scaffold6562_cov120-Isochrysis_galbana.AAC.9
MEQTPADARAAPSASGPTDMATETTPSPKRPRDPSSDNKLSTTSVAREPDCDDRNTGNLSTALANACQSLAHPTTTTRNVAQLVGSRRRLEPQGERTVFTFKI